MDLGRRLIGSQFVGLEAIMKRKVLRAIFGMMAFVLLGCLLGRPAYAYSYYYESPVASWNFGADYQYHSYNWAAYNDMGYYEKDNFSSMNIAASLYTDPSNIYSVAVITYGDLSGNEHHEVGPVATWNSGMGYNDYVTSNVEYLIRLGRGETGAMGYGWGYVEGPNDSRQRIGSEYFTLGVIDDLGPIQPTSMSDNGYSNGTTWSPGARNFVGSDGRLYGVGFIDSNGDVVVPDMIRVKLDDGREAYISTDEMDAATFGYASTRSDRLQASRAAETEVVNAVKESVREVLGTTIDNDNAEALIASFSQPSRQQAGEGLIKSFSGSNENASDTERDYAKVLSLVREKTSFGIPAYAEDGITVIGTYTLNRV